MNGSAESGTQADDPDGERGRLANAPSVSEQFFTRIYDWETGELRLEKRGTFWDAVRVAHDKGRLGQGRVVAILDSGFDLRVPRLTDAALPGSDVSEDTVDKRGHHGTNVALLVNEVAPHARLLLLEVAPGLHLPSRRNVADAISAARGDADVINMSLEFGSECRLTNARSDIALLAMTSPPRDGFLSEVRRWIERTDPYDEGGCKGQCAICRQLDQVRPDLLVVGAAGNVFDKKVCPACHTTCIGVGFHRQESIEDTDEGSVVLSGLPEGYEQNMITEFLVEQPPGFLGTSFASPLMSGFAALTDDWPTLRAMARLPSAMFPVLNLQTMLHLEGQISRGQGQLLLDAYRLYREACPPSHRHWQQPNQAPCEKCSLFMMLWYLNLGQLHVYFESPGMMYFTAAAEAVIPYSPGIVGNHGAALVRRSRWPDVDASDRQRLLNEAIDKYQRANGLDPGNTMFVNTIADIRQDLQGA